ncbi:methanol oxidation system protein MoxJ [Methylobacter sp.]|uniref:methanol oxidation system protein MoxJ n=1 Tax=Methylobacter sp. TaxID=2051955 RepID=UPI00248A7B47|nr:methanol oxidation system protein MoxJ [Methylobacter sp.]MDI1277691.1 methanol oxidation system protein MoxJ [Methylobacter sp.]MDI1358254.1 methanol oxidation system protein MoxJ [Methylobacter sp.]
MQINKFLITALCLGASFTAPQAKAEAGKPLKVCAAENEMPYSNKAGEGFENKLAELVGKALGKKVEYLTWSDPRYYIRDTLDKGLCDVAMGVDKGDPRVLTTQPYYRSGYVFISREADHLDLLNWDSEALRKVKRIAFVPGTPPEVMMKAIGRYNDMFNYSQELVGFKSARNQYIKYETSKLVSEISSGHAELAALWGPSAARYVKASATPLAMTMIPDDNVRADGQKVDFHFSTSMGIRKNDPALLAQLNKVIEDHQDEITELLKAEGIPLVAEPNAPEKP